MIKRGTPCRATISLMYISASLLVLSFSLIGKKCAYFVKLSTITQIVSWPLGVVGNFIMKSIEICSHFHLGISGCCSRPEGFWYSAFTLAHVKHLPTYTATSPFILGHQ
ncbi:hypothetical protein HanHA300_Chr16g0606951 [Helianthus annuus]|nr:hypothetical protein HanHA300_Chr16g0606951 [Helianthus annuus]KAJ0460170.1 hypothetical protein HanHA89_Chr16g0657551 [Helianthus annuus]KAJ0640611.1 hypothetical protein HanLR1_Chr16g0617561 [Helianthus annuus]KAJ0644537.1 hypothetical protein HanOQP8_Chr16g0613331 [Helianthus annuus]